MSIRLTAIWTSVERAIDRWSELDIQVRHWSALLAFVALALPMVYGIMLV